MTIDSVIHFFCTHKGITKEELIGKTRRADIWLTQNMVWHYLHYNLGMSATQLSKKFNRNRPSIFRGIRVLKQHIKFHKHIKDEYESLIKKMEESEAPSTNDMERIEN